MTIDALNDPAFTIPRKEGRSGEEICRERHAIHMRLVGQAGWLRQLFEKADKMRAEQEAQLEKDLADMRIEQEMLAKAAKSPTVKRTRQRAPRKRS